MFILDVWSKSETARSSIRCIWMCRWDPWVFWANEFSAEPPSGLYCFWGRAAAGSTPSNVVLGPLFSCLMSLLFWTLENISLELSSVRVAGLVFVRKIVYWEKRLTREKFLVVTNCLLGAVMNTFWPIFISIHNPMTHYGLVFLNGLLLNVDDAQLVFSYRWKCLYFL